ncbi:MAG: D-alanyl-D-alanine carboxypeptidase/D-alanyl-D-alanine-endopeptidase [Betaproteobacteria bacterium]
MEYCFLKSIRCVLFCLALSCSPLAALPANSTEASASLPASLISALAQAGIPEGDIGLFVQNLTRDREVVSYGADRALNPASVMKLVTTFAALELLGPAYKWKTEAWLDGRMDGDRLVGNLLLKGYGDPKFDLESLWLFLRDLRHRGIRVIDGDLLLDRSYFAIDAHDPALFDNEPTRPYNVGADALLLNGKSFRLQFVPNDARQAVDIYAEPTLPQILVVNRLRLVPGECDAWPEKPAIVDNVMTFSGAFPAGCGEKFRYFSLLSPDDFAQALFRQLWVQVGGSWAGRAREATLAPGARLLATWESPPLSDLMREVNKLSVNVMARQIFLTLGAMDGAPATLQKSRRTLDQWFSRHGFSFPELVIENGAGLSRADRISARHLAQLLIAAYRSPLMPEYVSSLSLTATDGTMKRRLGGSAAAGRAHVKTGYIEGVRAIAGYALDNRGDTLAVVLVINHPDARNAQSVQDALLEWVHAGAPL